MIFFECNADKQLLLFLGKFENEIDHSGDKGRVVVALEKNEEGLGIVDEDPGSNDPKSMNKYAIFEETGDIRKIEHSKKVLIIINPYLEGWYYNHARKHSINPVKYGLPTDASKLKDDPAYYDKTNFLEFQKDLFHSCREFQTLKMWL